MKSKIKLGVSLYSYQDEFFRRAMTLEECIESVADMGATGIEILPDEMIRNPFHQTDAFFAQWFEWMEKYGVEPVAMDAFCDENRIYEKQGRKPTLEEALTVQRRYIDLAARLGVRYIRSQIRNLALLDELVPYAEDRGVILGLEIHAPGRIHSQTVEEWIEQRERRGTKMMALIPDFGIFETRPTPLIQRQNYRDGCREEFVRMAEQKKAEGFDQKQTVEYCRAQGATERDLPGVTRVFNQVYNDPEELREILPYVCGFHGKFWNMTDELLEESVDYANPIRVLIEAGFDGYINSEYEGNRHIQDIQEVRGVEQVRRHHAMIRNYIDQFSD